MVTYSQSHRFLLAIHSISQTELYLRLKQIHQQPLKTQVHESQKVRVPHRPQPQPIRRKLTYPSSTPAISATILLSTYANLSTILSWNTDGEDGSTAGPVMLTLDWRKTFAGILKPQSPINYRLFGVAARNYSVRISFAIIFDARSPATILYTFSAIAGTALTAER